MTTILQTDDPRGILLFAPGAGGDPTRYARLLGAANAAGFIVASPAHELVESYPDDVLLERVTALRQPLSELARLDLPVVVAGHSLGGFAALCLAGGRPQDRDGRVIDLPTEPSVSKAVLVAPAAGWFSDPSSLADVAVPLTVLVGSEDDVTPPETADALTAAPAPVDLRSYDGVGHFDFMSPLPENKMPVVADHDAFYERFAQDFVAAITK